MIHSNHLSILINCVTMPQAQNHFLEWQQQSQYIWHYLAMGIGFIEGVLLLFLFFAIKKWFYQDIGGRRWEQISWFGIIFCVLNVAFFGSLTEINFIKNLFALKFLCWVIHFITLIIFLYKGSQWANEEP